MAPRPDEEHEPLGVDQDQEQVRRLLAATGAADRPMPEEVATRLDDVLADLVRERASDRSGATPEPGPVPPDEAAGVTELASRRRRWRPRLLVAAAAVSVLALGVGVSLDDLTGGGGDAASTAESAGGLAGPEDRADSRLLESHKAPPPPASGLPAPTGPGALTGETQAPRIRRAHLRADLQQAVDAGLAVPVDRSSRTWREACVHPGTARGDRWLPVRLDSLRAVLVLRATDRGRRTAEVFVCGSPGTPAASATLKAR